MPPPPTHSQISLQLNFGEQKNPVGRKYHEPCQTKIMI